MNIKSIALAAFLAGAVAPGITLADTPNNPDNRGIVEKTGDAASNAALTAKVKTALMKEKNLKSLAIDVDSTDGVVTLSGKLASTAQIEQAVDVTKNVKGVKDVHNSLELKTDTKG